MQNTTANEPLRVTQEAVEAYEKRTGFYGIGKIMVESGHWVVITKEELTRSRAPPQNNCIATYPAKGRA